MTDFREVIPDQTGVEKWIDITLNTGGSPSTLQDFIAVEKTGGYAYADQSNFYTRNRFIYWRFSKDSLELIEQSLDINLSGSRVRYKFADTQILDGISIHEVDQNVIILVATVSSVHRLVFPHPSSINNTEHSYPRSAIDYTIQSIFADASSSDPSRYIINNSNTNSPLPHTSATGLTCSKEESLFALAYSSGNTLLIRMNSHTGYVAVVELSHQSDNLVPRFISRALRGRSREENVAVSMLFHNLNEETLLFSLCRDGNIRVWSPQRHQSVLITDFPSNPLQGADNHVIKKAVTPDGDLIIGLLHNFSNQPLLHLLQCSKGQPLRLTVLASINPPMGNDIVDFSITGNSDIWAIFRTPNGECSLAYWHDDDWRFCILENSWDRELPADTDCDPKETYLDFIFHPGRFPTSVITKALSIYKKSNIAANTYVSTQGLKERVCTVVDAEIKAEIQDQELTDEEAAEIMTKAWQKFYNFVVEYYESGTRPLGLLVLSNVVPSNNLDSSSILYKSTCEDIESEEPMEEENDQIKVELVTYGAVLIKKSYISIIRPMDSIESVAFRSSDETDIPPDVKSLILLLSYLDSNVRDESKIYFDKCLRQLKSPILIVSELFLNEMQITGETMLTNLDILYNLANNVGPINDFESTIARFFDLLHVGQPDLDDGMAVEKSRWIIHLGHLFNSKFGMSFVGLTLHQLVLIRFELCRTLLILLHIVQTQEFLNFAKTGPFISKKLTDLTSQLIQCFFLLLWVASTPVHSSLPLDNMETSVSILKILQSKNLLFNNHSSSASQNMTILQLFLRSSASATVRLLLAKRDFFPNLVPVWKNSLMPFVEILAQLMWPICNNTIFPVFLICSGQYLHVQEYTRLLIKWCHSNSFSRKFLLACSFLDVGETQKAFDLFIKASHGVCIDEFIIKKVLKVDGSLSKNRLLVLYFCKIITLFEQHSSYDLIIKLAENGISVATKSDPELSTLYSVIFLNRLKLCQYEEAYKALMDNPDGERRKDCLQQLVVTLIDARQLGTLLSFPYNGIQAELERIVEARARSLEVFNNVYYNFAYAFYTKRQSFRKAACIMYEEAFRIAASQQTTIEALEKQVHCLVVALNCLNLVNKEDAWIVKPAEVFDKGLDLSASMECGKGNVEVAELTDLHKELVLAKARLKVHRSLLNDNQLPAIPLSPHEVLGILIHYGCYKDALQICQAFGISSSSTFSGLAAASVRLDEVPNDTAWDWLKENDLEGLGQGTAATMSWRLLERLLEQQEGPHESHLHRVVTGEILRLGAFIPNWLLSSYKKRNPAELLRIFLTAGRLEETADLAIEFLEAVQGRGKDRFNLRNTLLPDSPSVWVPHNIIDLILMELKAHVNDDLIYKELEKKLSEVQASYLKMATSVSKDKLEILQQEMSQMRAF